MRVYRDLFFPKKLFDVLIMWKDSQQYEKDSQRYDKDSLSYENDSLFCEKRFINNNCELITISITNNSLNYYSQDNYKLINSIVTNTTIKLQVHKTNCLMY